jgi:hypothetical protein
MPDFVRGYVAGLSPKKYVDLSRVSGYINLFHGQAETLGLLRAASTCEPKSGKTSIFGVRSRIYSG